MSHELEFFMARAEEAAAAADAATLDNVRVRELRSEAAWRLMAARRRSIDENRRVAAESKAAVAND